MATRAGLREVGPVDELLKSLSQGGYLLVREQGGQRLAQWIACFIQTYKQRPQIVFEAVRDGRPAKFPDDRAQLGIDVEADAMVDAP